MDARRQFHGDLENLQQDLLRMGALVEESIFKAVRALIDQDAGLAEQVLAGDDPIDEMEIEIETRSLRLIALQQPMAGDLRILGTALKAVTDLERMADHSVDIAKVVLRMRNQLLRRPLLDIPRMAHIVEGMVRDSLTAYIRRDVALAESLADRDDEVDRLYGVIFRELLGQMNSSPQAMEQATQLIMAAQNLERIADHATNIGEWVIYMVDGVRRDLNI